MLVYFMHSHWKHLFSMHIISYRFFGKKRTNHLVPAGNTFSFPPYLLHQPKQHIFSACTFSYILHKADGSPLLSHRLCCVIFFPIGGLFDACGTILPPVPLLSQKIWKTRFQSRNRCWTILSSRQWHRHIQRLYFLPQ